MKHFRHLLPLIVLGLAARAYSDDVVLRLTARNPDETNRVVAIKSYLPPEVRPGHIRDLDGTELAYDVRHKMYFVRAAAQLPPGVAFTFAIRFSDIWTIPTQYIDRIEQHVAALQPRLRSDNAAAGDLSSRALNEIGLIRERQENNAAGMVRIERHVNAYNANVLALEQVVNAVRRLEDMAISEGLDPGWLVPYFFKPKADAPPVPAGNMEAVIRISVTNRSSTASSTLDVRRDLPFEVTVDDVLRADGLTLGMDERRGFCFVATNGLRLAPGQHTNFNVVVRDRWNVNGDRIASLRTALETDLSDVRKLKKYISVEESLEQLVSDLTDIMEEAGPDELNSGYVAFYRDQTRRLDALEAMWKRVQRIEFPPRTTVPSPNRRQTRLIACVILGLLVLTGVIVMLRSVHRKTAAGQGCR